MNKAKTHAILRAAHLASKFIESDIQFIMAHDRTAKSVTISTAKDADTVKRLYPEFTISIDTRGGRYAELKLNYA